MHQAQNKHRVIYGAREDTLHIFTPFTKTHIHLNNVTYHIAQQKEPREGHSHRPSSEMVPSTYRRLSRQSLPQMFPNKGSRISRHPPWEPGTCIRMAVRPPASLPPTPHHKAQAAYGHLMLPPTSRNYPYSLHKKEEKQEEEEGPELEEPGQGGRGGKWCCWRRMRETWRRRRCGVRRSLRAQRTSRSTPLKAGAGPVREAAQGRQVGENGYR